MTEKETRTVNVNFRMEKSLKEEMEALCQDLGMNMTTAFTIFAKKMCRERRIPFEVSADDPHDKDPSLVEAIV